MGGIPGHSTSGGSIRTTQTGCHPGHPCRATHFGCPTRGPSRRPSRGPNPERFNPATLAGPPILGAQTEGHPGDLLGGLYRATQPRAVPSGRPNAASLRLPIPGTKPERFNPATHARPPILGAQPGGHPGAAQLRGPNPGHVERFNSATQPATPSGPPNPSGSTRATRPGDLYRGPIVSRMPPPA